MRCHGEREVFQGYIIGLENGILREGFIRKWKRYSPDWQTNKLLPKN